MKEKFILTAEFILVSSAISFLLYSIYFFEKKTIEVLISLLLLYFLIVYKSLFIYYKQKPHRIKDKENLKKIKLISELKKHELVTTSTINRRTYIQPINVIIITNKKIEKIMKKDGWIECQTYSKHNIKLVTLIRNALKKIPPITDAYFLKNPQNLGYQKDETYKSRNHIRIWKLGKNKKQMYIGAISLDDNLSIRNHNGLYTPSHSIDPDVDIIRDNFIRDLKKIFPKAKIKKEPIGNKRKKDEEKYYYTDGYVSCIEI